MIRTIIIDDEPSSVNVLSLLLKKKCKEDVQIVATTNSPHLGKVLIEEHKPDLVFLDIEMPGMNGFEMLQKLPSINFSVIFTTSYDQYAIKAIRFSALDYLLKPIDREELQIAVQKAITTIKHPLPQQIEILLQKLNHPAIPVNKIAIPTMEGLNMILVESIISCASDSNYTILFLKNRQKIIASRTLKEIEEMLEDYSFVRVHHSYIVNLNEVEKYIKGEGGYLVMSDGSTVDVSRSKKEILMKRLLPK